MMPVNTILHLTPLPIRARIEPRQKRNGDQLVFGGPVLVLEGAGGALGAGAAQVVVVAELVVVAALLDGVEGCLGDLQGGVETAGAGVPLGGFSFVVLYGLEGTGSLEMGWPGKDVVWKGVVWKGGGLEKETEVVTMLPALPGEEAGPRAAALVWVALGV